jgi:exonuclease VII small subunit
MASKTEQMTKTTNECFSCAEPATTTAYHGADCCAECFETEELTLNEIMEKEAFEIYWEALQSFKSAEKLLNTARERLEKISTKNSINRFIKEQKGTDSKHYCDQHPDEALQHDGDGGHYCDDCDTETQHD